MVVGLVRLEQGQIAVRFFVVVAVCGLMAGCTTGSIAPPRDQILYEVPQTSGANSMPQNAGSSDFTDRIEAALAHDVPTVSAEAGLSGTPIDDDRLNLAEYTLEQQRIDAAIAERELEAAREQLVIVQPDASVPHPVRGANIALYAKQTSHAVGEKRHGRGLNPFAPRGNCRRFASADEAQRVFLTEGGPERDPRNLDPDGDGFACAWDPEPYRRLGL